MITYEYECTECGHCFEKEQSIKANVLRTCPACKCKSLERLVFGGMDVFVKGDPTTVGQLATRNYKRNKNRIDDNEAKKKELAPKEDKPWWGSTNEQKKKINKMNGRQRHKYIMEGD